MVFFGGLGVKTPNYQIYQQGGAHFRKLAHKRPKYNDFLLVKFKTLAVSPEKSLCIVKHPPFIPIAKKCSNLGVFSEKSQNSKKVR